MVKKRKINKKGRILIFSIILIIISAVLFFVFGNNEKLKTIKPLEIKTVDTIKGYDYKLAENETKYYKSLFKELKKILEKDALDEQEYAKVISQLFVADFYNLDNKVSKSDIGGTQFIYKDFRNDFESIAKKSIYKNVSSDVYGERRQQLPVVNKVTATVTEKSFNYGNNVDEKAYSVAFEIEYDKDLGYQKKGIIILIHNDKKLELAALE